MYFSKYKGKAGEMMQLDSALMEISNESKNLAVVLGASYGALSVVRSLGKKGIPVIVMGNKDFIGCSKYCNFYIKDNNNDKIVNNLKLIADKYDRKIVLMTDSDDYIDLIYKNWDVLKERYVSHICRDFDTFESLANKSRLYRLSSQLGINSPKTYFSNQLEEIDKFPVIVKPLDKSKLASIRGNKVAVCNNKKELYDTVEFVGIHGTDCIIQEIIKGDVSNLYSVTLFRSDSGRILEGYTGHKIRQYPIDFGTVSSFVIEYNRELLNKSIEILDKIDYVGVANFEYKYEPVEDKYYIIEVNGRFPMSTGVTELLNNDFVYNVYTSCLYGDKIELHKNSTKVLHPNGQQFKIYWVHFLQDLRARLTLKKYSSFILRPVINRYKIKWALWDRNDMKPLITYLKSILVGKLSKRNNFC